MTKIYNASDLGCIYWFEGDALFYAPTPMNGTIDLDNDGGQVDDCVAHEPVTFLGERTILNEVWEKVIIELKK